MQVDLARVPDAGGDPAPLRGGPGVASAVVGLWTVGVAATAASGCASFSDTVRPALDALDEGQPQVALARLNDRMNVSDGDALPNDVVGDDAVLLLDRGMVQQSLARWEASSRDLEVADEAIQLLDFSRDTLDEVGRYLFSDASGPYKAPSYEKLLIPTMQLVSYLARQDLQGALVEARRLTVMQDFVERNEGLGRALLGAGSYLAGFAHERAGRPDEALRYYDEALAAQDFTTLERPVAELFEKSGVRTASLEAAAARAAGVPAAPGGAGGELLVVSLYGRVPPKVAKRIPIGLALTYAGVWLGPERSRTARRLAGQGLVTWVNYPELAPAGGPYDRPEVLVDGAGLGPQDVYPVQELVLDAWERERGAVVASAIVRLLTRVAAGQVAQSAAGRDQPVGVLLSLGTQAALTAADVPDTRSWATLPANLAFQRRRVPAGLHEVRARLRGQTESAQVRVEEGGFAVVVAVALR